MGQVLSIVYRVIATHLVKKAGFKKNDRPDGRSDIHPAVWLGTQSEYPLSGAFPSYRMAFWQLLCIPERELVAHALLGAPDLGQRLDELVVYQQSVDVESLVVGRIVASNTAAPRSSAYFRSATQTAWIPITRTVL
jgi:hypothetical protein